MLKRSHIIPLQILMISYQIKAIVRRAPSHQHLNARNNSQPPHFLTKKQSFHNTIHSNNHKTDLIYPIQPNQPVKLPVIITTDTVVQPEAMMVKITTAPVTLTAMLSTMVYKGFTNFAPKSQLRPVFSLPNRVKFIPCLMLLSYDRVFYTCDCRLIIGDGY